MNENNNGSFGKFLLVILLLTLTGVALYEINSCAGTYLNVPLWLGVVAILGIFDIAIYFRVTKPLR